MSSVASGSRVRKACLPCIRAKAKCAPSEHGSNECHRCIRLNKQCVFEVIAKKRGPGPKSRSRVRHLEQRVESLIDLLSTRNVNVTSKDSENNLPVQTITPESSTAADTVSHESSTDTLAHYWFKSPDIPIYDPVEAGVLEEQHAYRLIEEFRTSFILTFPFVVVDVDGPTLRSKEPFLFLAILTVTAYDTPRIQYVLSGELKLQVARVVEYSRKSLEILQGLLVYGAWYHSFYHPASQQLTTILQLCVALVQELGLSKNVKVKSGKWSLAECAILSRSKGSLAEKRAYLGSFFLNVAYAQAWRKRTTLSYTRYMAQCCDAFVESSVPTDVLIRPLIKAGELLSRVNDQFSYDDIDNADVKGEILLEMSVTSFLAELKHIKDTTLLSPLLHDNTSLALMISLLDIGINEVSLHSSLWRISAQQARVPDSLVRQKMLHRTIQAATSYMSTLLNIPQPLLFPLGLGAWCGWFYAFIVICKLVFLQENERLGHTQLENIAEEIDNLIPYNTEDKDPINDTGVHDRADELGWSALAVAREYNVRQLLEDFRKKLRFTLPENDVPWHKSKEERDSLYSIGCIQHTMLHGFTKRLDRLASVATASSSTGQPAPSKESWQSSQPGNNGPRSKPTDVLALPFGNFMHFDSLNFDSVEFPVLNFPSQGGDEMLGDWMWDMAMDDFTMPSF